MRQVLWLGEYEEGGNVLFRVGRDGDELVAEWPYVATLRANVVTKTSKFEPVPDADPQLVDKVFRSLARALLRHLEQKLTLHGSGVTSGGKAVGIVGLSGAGKSTLAAALARQPGVGFSADDTLALEFGDAAAVGITLVPTERESWLLPDACTALGEDATAEKRPVAPPHVGEPAPLVAIVVPAFAGQEVSLVRLRGVDILESLVPSVVRFVIDDPLVQLREIEQLERLSAIVPVYRLTRPRRLADLPASVAKVLSLLQDQPS